MSRIETSFMRSYNSSWRKRRGRQNINSDQEILQALKTSRTHTEARDKLGVAHATFYKYLKQLREKGLLDCNNNPTA